MEIAGRESSGKSLLALRLIAEAQRQGKVCLMIDSECCFSPQWAASQGIDLSTLMVMRPRTTDETISIIDEALYSRACDLLVIDTLDAAFGHRDFHNDENAHKRTISTLYRFIPHLHTMLELTHSCAIIVSQLREKVDIQGYSSQYTLAENLMREHTEIRLQL